MSESGRAPHQRGAAAVEFALLLPVFMLMLLGMIDYGWYFYVDLAATNAAREGARAATTTAGICGSAGAGIAQTLGEATVSSYMQKIGYDGYTTATATCQSGGLLPNPTWQVTVVVDFPRLTGYPLVPMPASTTAGNTVARAVSVMRGVP
jgi:Flp pilus assembly protein TadG